MLSGGALGACDKDLENSSHSRRRPSFDLFDEKMDVIRHGLKFNQLSPSFDAHLGKDLLELSVDGTPYFGSSVITDLGYLGHPTR